MARECRLNGSLMPLPFGQVIHGDCLTVLRALPAECVDLIYLDPPFNTGATQSARAGEYLDSWPTMDAYLAYMRRRIDAMRRMLKPNSSFLLHCDWRTCHHFRLMLDEIFGTTGFVNHLIWKYGLGGSSPRRFARKHDDILFYANGEGYYFEPPRVPATSNRMRGMMKKASDVIDIPSINNMALERTGYPTQKPLALLEMLIDACCPPEGVVLDPFCGSGTTLDAAQRLNRRWIGIDRSDVAVDIAYTRCAGSLVTV
jgi:DNA modification methylase